MNTTRETRHQFPILRPVMAVVAAAVAALGMLAAPAEAGCGSSFGASGTYSAGRTHYQQSRIVRHSAKRASNHAASRRAERHLAEARAKRAAARERAEAAERRERAEAARVRTRMAALRKARVAAAAAKARIEAAANARIEATAMAKAVESDAAPTEPPLVSNADQPGAAASGLAQFAAEADAPAADGGAKAPTALAAIDCRRFIPSASMTVSVTCGQ